MSTTTSNYGFTKPTLYDTADIRVFNSNFDTIDGELHSVSEDLKVQKARMDTFTALPNGSTSGDAELADIRVAADGTNYGTAGEAVRNQILVLSNNIEMEIDNLYTGRSEITPELVDGYVKCTDGTVSNVNIDGYYKRTDYIPVPRYCEQIEHGFSISYDGNDGVAFFDSTKKFISGSRSEKIIEEIPNGTKYVMFTSYDSTFSHDRKVVVFITNTPNLVKCDIDKLVTFGDSHVARGSWQDRVIEHFNITEHLNMGVGSSTVASNPNAEKEPFISLNRIEQIKNADPDTIIIIGGTNDVHLETPLGTSQELSMNTDTKDTNTFYGAYGYLIETLLSWKPSLQIILCTTPQGYYDQIHSLTYREVSNAIEDIAKFYSLPIADIFGKCGINKVNLTTYSDDLIHYNDLGNDRIASVIVDTIEHSYLCHS